MDRLTPQLVAWRRTMRQFFLLELPAAGLWVYVWVLGWQALPGKAELSLRGAVLFGLLSAIALAGYVWFARLPPPRPATYPPVAPCPE